MSINTSMIKSSGEGFFNFLKNSPKLIVILIIIVLIIIYHSYYIWQVFGKDIHSRYRIIKNRLEIMKGNPDDSGDDSDSGSDSDSDSERRRRRRRKRERDSDNSDNTDSDSD